MNIHKNKPKRKQLGFSLVELMFSVAILGTITLIGYKIVSTNSQKEKVDGALETLSIQENDIVKIINGSSYFIWKDLAQGNTAIVKPLSLFYSDPKYKSSKVINSYNTDFYTRSFYPPCLIVTFNKGDKSDKKLDIQLLYAHKNNIKDSVFDTNTINQIVYSRPYLYNVKSDSQVIKKYNTKLSDFNQSILGGCGIPQINANSIWIDLNKSPKIIGAIRAVTDQSNNFSATSDSLGISSPDSASNTTMATNVYFDNIIKESTPYTSYYCDGVKATSDFAAPLRALCVAEASRQNVMFDGMQKITNSTLVGQNCAYEAWANFQGSFSANWIAGSTPAELQQNGASRIAMGCTWSNGTSQSTPKQMCSIPYDPSKPHACDHGNTYSCKKTDSQNMVDFSVCADDAAGNKKFIDQGCVLTNANWPKGTNHGGTCTPSEIASGASQYYGDTIYCSIGNNSSSQKCGNLNEPAYSNSGITPPTHKYQSLNLGQTVSLRSATPNGVTSVTTNPDIKVTNAGISAGFVMVKSSSSVSDSPCLPSQLGKIVQQKNENTLYTASQLICTYDPDFCGGGTGESAGYCYSPLKSQSLVVATPSGVQSSVCPAGLRVDLSYFSPLIAGTQVLASPICGSQYNGLNLVSSINGEITPIYNNSKITGVYSMCRYGSGDSYYYLANIAKIKCVSAAAQKSFTNCKGGADGVVTCG